MNPLSFLLSQWQRLLLYAAVAAAVLGVAWFHGYTRGELKLADYKAAQATEAVKIVVKQGAVTQKVLTRYVEVAGETNTVTKTVEKEVIRYVDQNPGLCLDADWRRLHDDAARNTVPGAPGAPPGGLRAPGEPAPGPSFPYRSPGAPDRNVQLRTASPLR